MPKRIYLPRGRGRNDSSGIGVEWTPTAQRLDISGWFDTMCGIEGDSMTLREFFDALGITEEQCRKAWKVEA